MRSDSWRDTDVDNRAVNRKYEPKNDYLKYIIGNNKVHIVKVENNFFYCNCRKRAKSLSVIQATEIRIKEVHFASIEKSYIYTIVENILI